MKKEKSKIKILYDSRNSLLADLCEIYNKIKGSVDVDINYIEYFVDAVELKSIHKAAEMHKISPQGLSRALKVLEKEIGVAILERSPRGVELTPEGKKMFEYFKNIVSNYGRIKKYSEIFLDELQSVETAKIVGRVNILVVSRFADTYLRKVLKDFNKRYPYIDIQIKSDNNDQIINRLAEEDVQYLGIVSLVDSKDAVKKLYTICDEKSLEFHEFCMTELYMCAKEQIINEIKENYQKQEDYAKVSYEYGYEISEYTTLKRKYQFNSIVPQRDMIDENNAIGSFSLKEIGLYFDQKYAYIPHQPAIYLYYGIIASQLRPLSECEKVFMEFLSEYF